MAHHKIIKTIACLVLGLMLSACVGAVNIPSSIVDKKTDSDPVVINPDDAIIKRCIMDNHASDITCESIVSKYPCILDPFGATCDITFSGYHTTARDNRVAFVMIRKIPTPAVFALNRSL